MLAFLYHICCKVGLEHDLDDTVEDEEPYIMDDQEEWYQKERLEKTLVYRPYGKTYLEALKKARIKDIQNQAVGSELFSYVIFLVITFLISYANRDADSFIIKRHIENKFVFKHDFHLVITQL